MVYGKRFYLFGFLTALCVAFGIAFAACPETAYADSFFEAEGIQFDKAEFYDPGDPAGFGVALEEQASVRPMDLSYEMLYFCEYESGLNYDQGLSWGDNYHALGAFQFDNRYDLGDFMTAVYYYNRTKYSMFKQFIGLNLANYSLVPGTYMNARLNAAWHAAYKADPKEFSQLQNGWTYDNYFVYTRSYLASIGINVDEHADCFKGMAWGMTNLFGASGWRYFVQASGIHNGMTDRQLVEALGGSVVKYVASRYPYQRIYWSGWQNRYRHEIVDCLNFLDKRLSTAGISMFRLYNPNTGEHFYTANAKERNNLILTGWSSESIGWLAPASSKTPVYRLYNPFAGDHHYTSMVAERDMLVRAGWRNEGVGWYSDDAHRVALYRQYNPYARTGTHNFTTSKVESDGLVRLGWRYEGVAWYGL